MTRARGLASCSAEPFAKLQRANPAHSTVCITGASTETKRAQRHVTRCWERNFSLPPHHARWSGHHYAWCLIRASMARIMQSVRSVAVVVPSLTIANEVPSPDLLYRRLPAIPGRRLDVLGACNQPDPGLGRRRDGCVSRGIQPTAMREIAGSMRNESRAWASRRARSAASGDSLRAKMNPR